MNDVSSATRTFALSCENGNMPESYIVPRQQYANQIYEQYK